MTKILAFIFSKFLFFIFKEIVFFFLIFFIRVILLFWIVDSTGRLKKRCYVSINRPAEETRIALDMVFYQTIGMPDIIHGNQSILTIIKILKINKNIFIKHKNKNMGKIFGRTGKSHNSLRYHYQPNCLQKSKNLIYF